MEKTRKYIESTYSVGRHVNAYTAAVNCFVLYTASLDKYLQYSTDQITVIL